MWTSVHRWLQLAPWTLLGTICVRFWLEDLRIWIRIIQPRTSENEVPQCLSKCDWYNGYLLTCPCISSCPYVHPSQSCEHIFFFHNFLVKGSGVKFTVTSQPSQILWCCKKALREFVTKVCLELGMNSWEIVTQGLASTQVQLLFKRTMTHILYS